MIHTPFKDPWLQAHTVLDEIIASAGDDGNVLIWAKADFHAPTKFGEEDEDAKETWMVKTMCRSNSRPDLGIYDLAWSPDGRFFVTGSTDNVARIFDASTGETYQARLFSAACLLD